MKNKIIAFMALALAISTESKSRDQIKIVGSSTVYPFATVVAERFGKTSGFKTPVIESTGSGGGLKLFCKGLGTQHPDITNASRRIKLKEVKNCEKNGVSDITEIKVGFDGIAIANAKSGPSFDLTLRDLYLALAKEVPSDKKGKEVKQGEIIGTVGSTGRSTGPHLDVRLNWFGTRLDPATVLNLN